MTNERDVHDPALDAAWRKHVRDEPSAALDRSILAAAHRAAQSGPRAAPRDTSPRWRAWMPLAVAATLGVIAFGVVQLMPRETEDTAAVVSDVPLATLQKPAPPAPATSRPAQSPAAPQADTSGSARSAPAPEASRREKTAKLTVQEGGAQPDRAQQREAPSPAQRTQTTGRRADNAASASESPTPAPSRDARKDAIRDAAPPPQAFAPAPLARGQVVAPAPAPPQAFPASPGPPPAAVARNVAPVDRMEAASPAQAARARTATARSPDDFIHEIERLRKEGRDADAALALAAFRAAYPDADARLPSGLREWARGVAQP